MDTADEKPILDYTLPDTLGAPPAVAIASTWDEVELETVGEVLTLRHTRDDTLVPNVVLAGSTAVFVLFAIVIVPLLHLSNAGRALWMILGFLLLACIGFGMQARSRTTNIRADDSGLTIDQGTLLDREHALIGWNEIASIELEPVDPADAARGMQLSIGPRTGEAIHTLADAPIGDLNETRRILSDRWKARRQPAKGVAVPKKVASDAVRRTQG